MSGFEKYKEIKHSDLNQQDKEQELQDFYNAKGQNRTLQVPVRDKYIIDYDADQLMEHYKKRNENKGADDRDFQLRTEYYFKNTQNIEAKVAGFNRLSGADNQSVDRYSRRYTNHWARKRRRGARKAADSYRSPWPTD